ncbi:recombination regulator RecX [Variovorax sp. YR216]|uniref:recombination regulator RecX n=1 Tax=Variovorax sp. YR216 TaxID=1882828 RepID=UPI00089C7433|nr:recombination regulator RecX [Variovorax sp. YR216]SEB12353.1 regulatory protein [Variovorax sp. YR216]
MTSKREEGRAGPSLKGRALRLLSQREHSRAELERKLRKYEEEPGTLARALDELAAKDFISETRVVQSVLHQRSGRLGAARVRQELLHKGIAPEAVAQAVASLQDTELDRARDVWRRRFGELPQDMTQRARQARFLLARGFSSAVIGKVLRADFDD